MRHLIPFTKDQLSIIETSLEASLKYADSEYIELVDEIIQEIKEGDIELTDNDDNFIDINNTGGKY